MSNLRNSIMSLADEMSGYRRELHQNPGTCYEEFFASNFIAEKLTSWGIKHERDIAETGIVATIEGQSNTSGRSIGIRADIDALDILERGDKPHISKIPGKMHGCGHDGHTSCLLGAAKYLSENNHFDGRVHLIFQPAEEGEGGAMRMIEEGLFERFPCDEVYAFHNWPSVKLGHIHMRAGPIMAGAERFEITIKGSGGHAAQPQRTVDPIVVGSHLVTALQTLVSRNTHPLESVVVSVTNFNAGTGAFNVITEEAKLSGTLRTFNPELRIQMMKRIEEMSRDTAALFGASATCTFMEGGYIPTVNTKEEVQSCADIARELVGEDNVDDNVTPTMGAEDFGAMLQEVPGCMVWMGQAVEDPNSAHNYGLHTPEYDFNDALIPQAVEFWVRLVEKKLPL